TAVPAKAEPTAVPADAADAEPAEAAAPLPPEAGEADTAERVEKALFSARLDAGVHVIRFSRSDVVDAHYIERLGDQIYHHLRAVDAPRIVVDLGHVEHLSSSALSMLIALRKVIVEKQGGAMCLANVREEIRQVFKLTKLDRLLKIHDGTQKAVADLA
ncbi:MAG: STAS domain-containing protein, partial [Planctomycetota bacterium]|nr:STAS domain-containing protein [Planctomycetota bacterium]